MITYVIDGPDGVGKSTLCTNLAIEISKNPQFIGVHVGMPNNSITGFRDMFLQHEGHKMEIINNSAVWNKPSNLYGASASLLVLANMCHTYAALTDYDDNLPDGKELVVFIDREVPSTLAYQFAHDTTTGITRNPLSPIDFIELYNKTMSFIPPRNGLIILHSTSKNPAVRKTDNKFDNRDQDELNTFFADELRRIYYGDEGHPIREWLRETYDYALWYESMGYSQKALTDAVMSELAGVL